MDTFLNKLKSTVSEVLPGNPLSSHFEIQERSHTFIGHCLVWQGYSAVKKSTKEPATVFVFAKKTLEKFSRDQKKEIISSLKQGCQQLTRLRHPRILSVTHAVEENRDALAFATEPVDTSLASLIDPDNCKESSKSSLNEVEIKHGLLHLLEALWFIHDNVKAVHGNIHPTSIILNNKRLWKLAGFDFYLPCQPASTTADCRAWDSNVIELLQPPLDYIAPERLTHVQCTSCSDIYSLAVTLHALYNKGAPVYQSHSSLAACKRHISELQQRQTAASRNIHEGLRPSFLQMLSAEASLRPDAKSLSKLPYFEDIGVLTLVYLDTLMQRDNLEKSQYFKNLPSIVKQLPQPLCLVRLLPILFGECANVDMIPFVLQNILIIADRSSRYEYTTHVLPHLTKIFRHQKPIQIPLMFLRHMPMLLEKTDELATRDHILPLIYSSLDAERSNAQLQELALDLLPNFANLIDSHSMKTSVVPHIKRLCMTTTINAIKTQCLVCLAKMMPHMDKWFVLDEILPFPSHIKIRDAGMYMGMLGVFKVAFSHDNLGIPKEQIATKCLPFLIPVSIDSCLSLTQYRMFMTLIKQMMEKMEKEHLNKMEKSEQMEKEKKSFGVNEVKDDGSTMLGFLKKSANVSIGGSSKTLGSPAKVNTSLTTVPISATTSSSGSLHALRPSTPPKQVKNLTATLGAVSIPKPPNNNTGAVNSATSPAVAPVNTLLQPQKTNTIQPVINWQTPSSSMMQPNTRQTQSNAIDWSLASKPAPMQPITAQPPQNNGWNIAPTNSTNSNWNSPVASQTLSGNNGWNLGTTNNQSSGMNWGQSSNVNNSGSMGFNQLPSAQTVQPSQNSSPNFQGNLNSNSLLDDFLS